METYRINSKLREDDREYLIHTTNDPSVGSVSTTIFVDGVQAETVSCPHPAESDPQEVLSLVKLTHGEKKKEVETLLQTYSEVVQQGDPDTTYQLGTAFFYKRFFTEAARLFVQAEQLRAGHHQSANYLGMTYLALGRFDEAVEAARRAVAARPGYADYRNSLGEAYLADNNPEAAIGEFQEAISVNMYYGDAYLNLGLAHLLASINAGPSGGAAPSVERITGYLHKASLIYPEFKKRSDFEDGLQALKTGDRGRALILFREIRDARKESRRKEFSAYYMRFVTSPGLVSERSLVDRIGFLEGELGRNPTYVDLQAELAHCYLEHSRLVWRKGVEQFRKTAEMNSSLPGVTEALNQSDQVRRVIDEAVGKITGKR
ncbi:MAG: tetratricopeptide repeat protein [bacterium]|nr:tetratricopeptide repeat protein [bacterium]